MQKLWPVCLCWWYLTIEIFYGKDRSGILQTMLYTLSMGTHLTVSCDYIFITLTLYDYRQGLQWHPPRQGLWWLPPLPWNGLDMVQLHQSQLLGTTLVSFYILEIHWYHAVYLGTTPESFCISHDYSSHPPFPADVGSQTAFALEELAGRIRL